MTDTSSAQARSGKDIQGIPWDRLNITRDNYRITRLEQYKNYENVPASGDAVDKVSYIPRNCSFPWKLAVCDGTSKLIVLVYVGMQTNGERWELLWILP